MEFKKFLIPGMAFLALTITGCKDKSNDPDDNPVGPGGNGTMQTYTPEAAKEFISDTATEFMNLFNPSDQKELIKLASFFCDKYGDYDLPDNFEIRAEEDDYYYNPYRYMRNMLAAANGDFDAFTRAAVTYTYNINFDKFKGEYEPSRGSWGLVKSSDDIVFKFKDFDSTNCELRITREGGNSEVNVEIYESYQYYDDEKYIYNISIPHTIKAELKQGGKVLASTTVTSSIDIDGHKFEANVTAEAANIKVLAAVKGTDSKIAATTELHVNGASKATAYATINGNGLCDKNKIEDLIDSEFNSHILSSMLTDASAGADVLGKVQAYAQAKYDSELVDYLDEYWDSYEYDSQQAALSACESACNKLNQNIQGQIRFNNTSTDQATMLFQPSLYKSSMSDYWEYTVSPVLYFPQDESTISIEDYFSKFTSVKNKWNSLLDSYEYMWENGISR